MSLGALVAKPKTELKRTIETDPRITVAAGLHEDSKIGAYRTSFENTPYALVLIYPAQLTLVPEKLEEEDSRYENISKALAEKEFKNKSPEEVRASLFKKIRGLYSIFNYNHTIEQTQVNAYLFSKDATDYLAGEIQDL